MDQIRYPVNNPIITQSYKEHQEWAAAHPSIIYNPGVDFVDGAGDKRIFAVAGGHVDKVGSDPGGYGNYIKIRHPEFFALYCHLQAVPSYLPGTIIQAGDQIGIMGYSGNVRPAGEGGTHLHFETRNENQVPFNPEPYFIGSGQPTVTVPAEPVVPSVPVTGASGRVRVVCTDPAMLRSIPGFGGSVFRAADKGAEFATTGQTAQADGLKWREIIYPMPLWVAERDPFGNQMLEDV